MPTPRVSVIDSWTVVASEEDAIDRVTGPYASPTDHVVLETDPGIRIAVWDRPVPERGHLPRDRARGRPDRGRTPRDPSIVVVRTAYDPGWSATVDGRPTTILPADGLLMGIPVEPGAHQIRLTYRDPDVTRGLQAGAVVWLGLALAYLVALTLERWRRRDPERLLAARPRAPRRAR